jgi:hypothetical protein
MPSFLAALIALSIVTGSECLIFLRNFAAHTGGGACFRWQAAAKSF